MKSIFLIFLLLSSRLICQTNLVPNPSFESINSCPPLVDNLAGGGVLQNWFNPNSLSPDYFNMCAFPEIQDSQSPHSDSAYIGITTYDPLGSNVREYVSVQLIDTLIQGKLYWIEFYTSVFEGFARFSSNNLAVHFSDTALHSTNPYYFDLDASIKYFNNEVIEDSSNWVKVSGIYQAHGGEQFLTLGNFNTDFETIQGMEYLDGTIAWQAYYIIDDVSVIPLDSIVGGISVNAGPDQTVYIGDTAFIGEKITNLPANWFKLDGTPVASNTAGLYVSPDETTTYVVTMSLNGFYSSDTVTVFVEGLGLAENSFGQWDIAPNPNKGTFSVQLKQALTDLLDVLVLDNQGRKVAQESVPAFSKSCTLQTTLAPGVYFLQLSSGNNSSEMKRVVVE